MEFLHYLWLEQINNSHCVSPPELKEKIESACKESGRSKNTEAVYRLNKSFETKVDSQNQTEIIQTAMVQIVMAATKAFEKKGLDWSEIQENLNEATKELAENLSNQK